MGPRIRTLPSEALLGQACSRYGLPKDELVFLGGYQNFIYEFEQGGRAYILRLTPDGLRTPTQVEADLLHGLCVRR